MLQKHASTDLTLMRLINEWCTPHGSLEPERRFYVELGGEKEIVKKIIVNNAVCIWFLKIDNTKAKEEGVPLASGTQQQKVKELFITFKAKGILYTTLDFSWPGEFLGVLQKYWESLKEQNPNFGKKNTKPGFDVNSNEKYCKLFTPGTLKPFNEPKHLMILIIMGLGRLLGFCGQQEIIMSKWRQFTLKTYEFGPDQGVEYVEANICDGHDKTTGLK